MTENTNTPATGLDTKSKTQALIEAARQRNANAAQVDQEKAEGDTARKDANRERVEELAENRQSLADVNVQSRAKTLTGKIDPLAMGDVKGDGRDAKDYDDNDPHKALGVTTAEHGLAQSTDGADGSITNATENHISRRTQLEMSKGRENIEARKAEQSRQRREAFGFDSERRDRSANGDGGKGANSTGGLSTGEGSTASGEGGTATGTLSGSTVVTDADDDQAEAERRAAEAADRPVFDEMTKLQLIEYAEKEGIEVDNSANKPELLAQVKAGADKKAAGE